MIWLPPPFDDLALTNYRVVERPDLLSSSRAYIEARDSIGRPVLFVYSKTALDLALAGVRWHDEPEHCRTWSEGCRCDLGSES